MDSLIDMEVKEVDNNSKLVDGTTVKHENDATSGIMSGSEVSGENISPSGSTHESLVSDVEVPNNSVEGEQKESLDGNASENSDNSLTDDDIELPSNVTDRKLITMPLDLRVDDPRIFGKWLLFTNDDLYRQDYVWIELQSLILNGLVILLESSTDRKCIGRDHGVIKCYTRGDKEIIKRAGLAIQEITKDSSILHYKTNQASKDGLHRNYGDRFITKYMLTVSGNFYEKDELDRWKQVKDGNVDGNFASEENYTCSSYERNAVSLPSQEFEKSRFYYPVHANMIQSDHFWSLFCNVTDFDRCGMSELDRTWIEAKELCDEGVFTSISCETFTSLIDNPLRRTVTCIVADYYNPEKLIGSGDKLRQRTSYNFPMYVKVCKLNDENKKMHVLKYLYTEDRDLYELVDGDWRLIKKEW